MPSERIAACFSDIIAAIDLIETWVADAGGLEQALYRNVLVRNAIERQLLIISEAASRLHKLDAEAMPLRLRLTGPAYGESAISSDTNTTICKTDFRPRDAAQGALQALSAG